VIGRRCRNADVDDALGLRRRDDGRQRGLHAHPALLVAPYDLVEVEIENVGLLANRSSSAQS
jgi:hypothetical protein